VQESPRGQSPGRLAPKAVVGRVSLYLRQLEACQEQGLVTVSSTQLGRPIGITDAQVRKDLAFFGQFGCPGIGYRVDDLSDALRRILGIDRDWPTALVGLGNLGQALCRYRGFANRRFRIVALLDNDPAKVGQRIDGLEVAPLDDLPGAVARLGIVLALLAVPASAAQEVAEKLAACGISGILNFAPKALVLPNRVSVVSVDLSVQLEHLAYKVQNSTAGGVASLSPSP
jgi:redox-sensing transcriptional repressor